MNGYIPITPEEERTRLLVQLQQFIPRQTAAVATPDGSSKEKDANQQLRERLADFIIADRRQQREAFRFPLILGGLEELDVVEHSAAMGANGVRLLPPLFLSQRRVALSLQLRGLCNGEA